MILYTHCHEDNYHNKMCLQIRVLCLQFSFMIIYQISFFQMHKLFPSVAPTIIILSITAGVLFIELPISYDHIFSPVFKSNKYILPSVEVIITLLFVITGELSIFLMFWNPQYFPFDLSKQYRFLSCEPMITLLPDIAGEPRYGPASSLYQMIFYYLYLH